MKVRVLIPFHLTAANKDLVPGEIVDVTAKQLANIKALNINMVEVVEEEKPKKSKE